jgi:hypothetical protein
MGTEGFAIESARESVLTERLPDYSIARREAGLIAAERGEKVFVVCRATGRAWPVGPPK